MPRLIGVPAAVPGPWRGDAPFPHGKALVFTAARRSVPGRFSRLPAALLCEGREERRLALNAPRCPGATRYHRRPFLAADLTEVKHEEGSTFLGGRARSLYPKLTRQRDPAAAGRESPARPRGSRAGMWSSSWLHALCCPWVS